MAAHMDRIKLLVVGDPGVGKSAFVNGIVSQAPSPNPSSTIGCNVEVLAFSYTGRQGHQRDVFLEFWEVGGSSGQRNSRNIFYSNANGLILVHDLSNRKSFLNLTKWLREVLNSGRQELTGISVTGRDKSSDESVSHTHNTGSIPVLVLGTKEDQSGDVTSNRSARYIGLTEESDVFFCDMNCLQQSQLLPTSSKWNTINTFLEKVIETRFYPSGRNLTQESEFWRGRKKVF
ncbi:rab-like protein 3 [Hydractinia symbiolongicarpus]|uniref:rab-like protein 3 n=1 Tax=Hydractinia symbiolongicarpus TaxID=13093 RepID=UPI00254A6DA2|nr:rab-like protein 3 [Hydractinia symbiolongicarpus]